MRLKSRMRLGHHGSWPSLGSFRSPLRWLSRVWSLALGAEVVLSSLATPSLHLASGLAVVGEISERQRESARADRSMSPDTAALRHLFYRVIANSNGISTSIRTG